MRKWEGVVNCFNVLKMKTFQDTSTYDPTYGKRANGQPIIFSTIPFLLLPMFLNSKPSEDHDTSMVPTMLNHPSRRDHVGHNLFGTYKSEMKKNRNQMKSQQGAAMKPAIDFQKGLLFVHLKSTLKHPFCINWHFLLAPLKEKNSWNFMH